MEPGVGDDAGKTVVWSDAYLVGLVFEGDKNVARVGGGGNHRADG